MGCGASRKKENGASASSKAANNTGSVSNKQTAEQYHFKILLLGDMGVGKTSLLIRFTENKFDEGTIPTINGDFKTRSIESEGQVLHLQIWDLGRKENYNVITTSFHRGAHGVILVYDITDLQSFKNISNWLTGIKPV
jgi:Ras-related protein Rab-1A